MDYFLVLLRICAIFGLIGPASSFYCPPLQSQGIQCFDNYDMELNCTEKQPIGTYIKCKEFYQSSLADVASCGQEGWSVPDFSCQIVCGRSKEVAGQDRPFGATLYQLIKKDMNSKICAGTLIGDGFVITIAHCLLDHMDKQLSNDVLLVGLGPVANETVYQVKDVAFSTKFNETSVVNPSDLAILTLLDFKLRGDVLPACLPSCGQMDAAALRDGSTGEIFPRGRATPEKLKVKVTANCTHFNDFCAGSPSREVRGKKCPEEIGTGITVPLGEETHFIYGILSPTAQPACKNYRTFKRIYPFVTWIKKVALIERQSPEDLDQPITTTESTSEGYATEGKLLPDATTMLTPEGIPTETTHGPTIYVSSAEPTFTEIPKEVQMKLVNLTIRDKTIQNEVLSNSLKFAKNLVRLDIRNSTLDSGFDAVEDLPSITHYTLTDVVFEKRPKNFAEYFPFFQARTLDLSEFPRKFEEVNIDDGLRRFLLQPSLGVIVISNFKELKVDKILTGLPPIEVPPNFQWRRMILENVEFHYDSIPSSLILLRLSSINITGNQMSKLLTKVPDLEILGIHDLGDRELKLEELPNKSLKHLRLDRANLTYPLPPFSPPTFDALVQFYWGLDVVLDEAILTNFATIFPNVKQAAYFGRNNLTLLETLLGLPKLELLYIRIHEVRSPDTRKLLDKINFDLVNSTVGSNVDMIHVCVERKAGEGNYNSRYLGSKKDLFEVNGRFDQGVDILQC